MAVTTVNLLHERRASSQKHTCFRAYCGARRNRRCTFFFTTHARLRDVVSNWKAKPEPEEGARIVALVAVEVRSFPLVRDRVIETPVAVNICCRDAAGEQRLIERKLCGDVVKTTIRGAHEEVIMAATADVIAGLQAGPTTRVTEQLIVAHDNLV